MRSDLANSIPAEDRVPLLIVSGVLAAAIALLNHFVVPNGLLSILYIVPLTIAAHVLSRWQVLACAAVAAILGQQLGPDPWSSGAVARILPRLIGFVAAALFISEARRQLQTESVRKLSEQMVLRREAEEDARAVIESSLAAIITVEPDGRIDMANAAARRLLGLGSDSASSRRFSEFFPVLADVMKVNQSLALVRTMVEVSGRRCNGEMFFAQLWLSSYHTDAGVKLAAVVADASEQLRDREELGLQQLLRNSRIIVGAVSHEIRNLAATADVLHTNIGKSCGLAGNEDFEALGRLIQAMRELSSPDVRASAEEVLTGVDVNALLKELHIIADSWAGADLELQWEVSEDLPRVRADHSGLLQVLLNITQNSTRALAGVPDARVTLSAYQLGASVVVRISDNGPGVASPEVLFQPFHSGATSTGLGLYISRAIIHTYGGELQYVRQGQETCFLIELPAITQVERPAVA